jgi:hypothetical protein
MYNNGNSSKNVTGASVVDGTMESADYADNGLSGDKIDGGIISNFQSTGIDDRLPTGKVLTLSDTGLAIDGKIELDGNGFQVKLSDGSAYWEMRGASSFLISDNGVEKLRILSSGGITFNGDTAAANALDDYEEGTWTPVLIGTTTAGTGTYISQDAKYTKVGNLVTFQMRLAWSAHTGTGTMQIQGLPYTTSSTGIVTATVYVSDVASSAGKFIQCFLSNSTTDIRLREVATGGGSAAGVAMDTAGTMFISGHYYV